MSYNSNEVVAGQDALASEQNDLRDDILTHAGDYAVATGSADAFILALDSDIDAYNTAQIIKFKANFTISGDATININSLGAKSLKYKGRELNSMEIQNGDVVTALYDGVDFQLLTPPRDPELFFLVYTSLMLNIILLNTNDTSAAYSDDKRVFLGADDSDYVGVQDMRSGGDLENRLITSDWAAATDIIGMAKLGEFLYVGMTAADNTTRVYRYAINDLASGGTQMTIATLGATAKPTRMICDGTNLYFNNDGGDTAASLHIWEKFTISGTVLTEAGKTTCGATSANFTYAAMDALGNFYGYNTTDDLVRRYDSSGTLQATLSTSKHGSTVALAWTIEGYPYMTISSPTASISFQLLPLLP